MKKLFALLLTFALLCSTAYAAAYTPGVYTASEFGMNGDVTVTITFSDAQITDVTVAGKKETPGIGTLALDALPAPTHAFIGGSSGNLKEIIHVLLGKNRNVRMVINCITLETVSEAMECIRQLKAEDENTVWETDIVQLSVSRSKSIGRYHMMMGENPIYVITIQAVS